MASTYISSLTDAGVEDPKDKFPIQRQVLGIWTDYHTNIETYFGPVTTIVYEWDGQTPFGASIVCPSGQLLIFCQGMVVFTPGASPTLGSIAISVVQGSSLGTFLCEYADGATGSGMLISPLDDPEATLYSDLDQDLNIGSSGVDPTSGSTRIIIQYLLIDAV